MSMKSSNDTIGNRTSDLPVCGAVPQPTAPTLAKLPSSVEDKERVDLYLCSPSGFLWSLLGELLLCFLPFSSNDNALFMKLRNVTAKFRRHMFVVLFTLLTFCMLLTNNSQSLYYF